MIRAMIAAAWCAAACGPAMPPPPPDPAEGATVTAVYPNVHARLRVTQQAPGVDERVDELELWLDGSRFHVRDLSGRPEWMLVEEVTAPRRLGVPARSVEDLMDRHSAKRRRSAAPTDLYGDLATGDGWVYPPHGDRWPMPAAELAPVAEQILARGRDAGLAPGGGATLLGRGGTEYRGVLDAEEDGHRVATDVTRVLAPPYLLRERNQAAGNADHYYARELIALDEGVVTDADLAPP